MNKLYILLICIFTINFNLLSAENGSNYQQRQDTSWWHEESETESSEEESQTQQQDWWDRLDSIEQQRQEKRKKKSRRHQAEQPTYRWRTEETVPKKQPQPVRGPAANGRGQCVNKINQMRASINLPPLARWTDGESCADNQARQDSASNAPHGSMGSCGEFAQNTCPGYSSVNHVNQNCLMQMWNEGPPPVTPCEGQCYQEHGHYMNMTNPNYSKVACGYHVTHDGRVWANINFR